VDRFDRQIVQFVVTWLPYGGPPDADAVIEFGMSPAQLLDRCRATVGKALRQDLPAAEQALVRSAARALDVRVEPLRRNATYLVDRAGVPEHGRQTNQRRPH
jgi:hypothetical protein